jgi:AraC family transcriptional regulator
MIQMSEKINPHPTQEMVIDRVTGKTRPVTNGMISSSASLGWDGVLVEHHRLDSCESGEIMWINNVVLLYLGEPVELEIKTNGDYETTRMLPGQITIRPALSVSSVRTGQPVEFATISLTPDFISIACCNLFNLDSIHLQTKSCIVDPYAESVCRTLLQETENGCPTGRMYAESLATSLAVHLASQHGGGQTQAAPRVGGLSGGQLKRAIEYIHQHLSEEVSLKNISQAAGLSPFHFARQFKLSMGYSPYQFVLRQRIEQAKQNLLRGGKTLAEIAIQTGFYDQSHFAQQFKRHCGITPKKFASRCAVHRK